MGKAGVEPNDPNSAVNAMWLNQPDRIASARHQAHNARANGNHASAHSIMLSAYITALGGKPVERHHPVKFFLLALWHAFCMFRRRNELNHNQLDVWLQFMLKLRSKLPFFKTGRTLRMRWYPQFDLMLLDGAKREIKLAEKARAKPHQLALAHMTYAEVTYAVNFRAGVIEEHIQQALDLESQIRAEPDQPQGLRQFVRILRKVGELYGKEGMFNWQPEKGRSYLKRAIELARGEADTADQADKIEPLLRQMV